jgi:peptidase inhibitor family I36
LKPTTHNSRNPKLTTLIVPVSKTLWSIVNSFCLRLPAQSDPPSKNSRRAVQGRVKHFRKCCAAKVTFDQASRLDRRRGFMKTFSVLVLGVVVGLCTVSRVDAAVQFGGGNNRARADQVCVYKDINYQGAEQCYSAGDDINNLGAQSKSISSIRVYGRAPVTVYENTDFRGRSAQFTSDVSDLGQRVMSGNTAWSDHINSLRIGQRFRTRKSQSQRTLESGRLPAQSGTAA